MKRTHKYLSILLTLAMLLGMIPAMGTTAMAAPGGSSMDPVICDTFEEFKAAMEDPDIIYVSLHAVDEVLPLLEEGRRVAAITVVGDKDLYLADDSVATFVANANGGVYDSLLQVGAGSSLSIDGNRGWLVFEAVGTASHNAVIYNEGGDVSIYGGYLKGRYNTATYGHAIWQDSGTLTIEDGDFESMDGTANKVGSKETCAVYLAGGSAHIRGGKFHVEETKDPEAEPFSLCIEEDAEAEISGGIFYGIRPPDNTAVGNYIANGCEMTIGGVLVDPMLYGIIDDTKRVTVGHNIVIEEIKSTIAKENVARAGKEVRDFMPTVPDGEPYERPWNGAPWYDAQGVAIDPPGGMHYDIGYEFEAGRTYYADYKYSTEYGYVFAENPTITLTGPDPSMFTYEIIDRSDDGTEVTVRYTFTIPGEFNYPDINKVSLIYIGGYAEGEQKPNWAELIYNNCTMTREEWNAGTWGSECDWEIDSKGYKHFKAGKTYVHMIELTAKDGYKFSEDLLVQKGRQSEEEFGEVVLSNDRTVATVTYTYTIAGMEYLDTVRLDPKAGDNDFYLIRGDRNITSGVPFTTYYKELVQPDLPYEVQNSYKWFDVETGEEMRYGIADQELELGKQYRLEFNIDIKDEYYDAVRFSDDTELLIDGYLPGQADYVKIETVTAFGAGQIKVKITYTVQPKSGEGSGQHYPVVCYTYDEFKYAMENDDLRYVALGDVDDMMPLVSMNKTGPYNDNRCPSIWVNSTKILTLLGDAQFTAPMAKEDEHRVYDSLIQVRPGGKLNITGSGSLTFHGNAVGWPTATVAVEEDGVLSIESGTVRGDTGNRTAFCYAVNVNGGTLYVYDGTLIGTNRYDQAPISAVNLYDGKAYIHGGTFKSRVSDGAASAKHYGLSIGADATAYIAGGSFDGISLPPSTQSHTYRMSDYVESGYVMTIDGVKSTPSIYHTISGSTVEVYKEISAVNIHVNSPAAGKAPATTPEEVYLVPEGTTVKSITWYENGELWSDIDFGSARFEAGNTYKVEIALVTDNGVKFANPLTSATINGKEATVTALEDDRETGIVLTVNMGACPSIIDLVELNITAPKEGNTVSFSIGDNSSAYQTMGAANSASEYREWMVSDTGAAGTYQLMKEGDKFVSGKYYKIVVWVQTANHYEFPVYDNGISIQPNVSATVNGYYASVTKAYEQDPSRIIEVEYNFGMCNDDTVEQIAVVDVTAPVAGEKPSYTYNILGSGYQMNTAKNAYYDDWMHDQKLYYIKNGIGWFDVTDGGYDYVYENDTFIPGHEYRVMVYLKTEDGYEFAHNKDYELQISATVNGNTAGFVEAGFEWISNQRVTYTFTCEAKEVSAVLLYDLDAPQGGKNPDTAITTAYPELYTVEKVTWFDYEDNLILPTDTFEEGVPYKVEVKIVPTQYGGVNACTFVNENFKIYLDGNEVGNYYTDAVYVSGNAVYLYYTFRKGASAPEAEPNPDPIVIEPKQGDDTWSVYVDTSKCSPNTQVVAVSYVNGQLKEIAWFDSPELVNLTGDTVKIFYLDGTAYTPQREAAEYGKDAS